MADLDERRGILVQVRRRSGQVRHILAQQILAVEPASAKAIVVDDHRPWGEQGSPDYSCMTCSDIAVLLLVATAFPHAQGELWAVDEHRIGPKPILHTVWGCTGHTVRRARCKSSRLTRNSARALTGCRAASHGAPAFVPISMRADCRKTCPSSSTLTSG